jgi:hypothetical protein
MTLLYFIIFICQYIYLNYIFNKNNPNIVKSFYKYNLNKTIKEQHATIYRTHRNVKKVIIFFSGAYLLEYHYYVKKIMYDLDNEYKNRMSNYELICYEKPDKTSFDIYEDVHYYILNLNKELGNIEELILFGFSAGGVVASHVMEKCKNINCKKKIITYDTPWQVYDNIKSFNQNMIYRFDILFFWKVYNVYSKHYNYNDIKHFLKDTKWNNGSNELTKLIKNIHKCNDEEFYRMTGFNLNQTEDTKVYNIYSHKDIFAIRKISDDFVEKNKDKIKFFNKNIVKNTIGHCSDMVFSTDYLTDIIISINY